MLGVKVTILRYVSDDPQPGIVECQLNDAHHRLWLFLEKTAIVSQEHLDARSTYPKPGVIPCEVIARTRDVSGREMVKIDTRRPVSVESSEGATQFDIWPESLVELE